MSERYEEVLIGDIDTPVYFEGGGFSILNGPRRESWQCEAASLYWNRSGFRNCGLILRSEKKDEFIDENGNRQRSRWDSLRIIERDYHGWDIEDRY